MKKNTGRSRFHAMTPVLLGLTVALCGLAPTAHAQAQAVAPGQLFSGNLLNVHAPESAGWLLAGAGNNGMAFAKRGNEPDETYGAQIILFKLPPADSTEEFVELVRHRVANANPQPRFVALQENFEYTDQRGYPCVRYSSVYDDREALTANGTRATMKLQVLALYCRHPSEPQIGFFAAYSHRGAGKDQDMEAPAQKFIDGVQVPQQVKN